MKSVTSLKKRNMQGKTALVRVDLDLETVRDTFRISEFAPTIRFLREQGMRVVILGHRGRPKEIPGSLKPEFQAPEDMRHFSFKEFVPLLSKNFGSPVVFFPHFFFDGIKDWIGNSSDGIFLLENTRFLEGERSNSIRLAQKFASLGDVFVNDAFATCHRENASVVALAKQLPSYAGMNLSEEISRLEKIREKPEHPLTILVGGAKVHGKISVLKAFEKKADHFLLGGGISNTFLSAAGKNIKKSLVDRDRISFAKKFSKNGNVFVPEDVVWSGPCILDIGKKTSRKYREIILNSKTVVWAGPMGRYEEEDFSKGTGAVWRAVLDLAERKKKSRIVVGGGETIASLKTVPGSAARVKRLKNLFLSTGGGAMLAFLSREKLPGIEALR